MQQTIHFLDVLDSRIRRHSQILPQRTTNYRSVNISHEVPAKKSKFPFAGVLDFTDNKFSHFPKWLTEREDFFKFMYKNYEKRLLAIPKICDKEHKASDERYFVSLYLNQIAIFQDLPPLIMDILLNSIRTKYYDTGAIIHKDNQLMEFMAIVFVGSVQYHDKSKRVEVKIKNDVIMSQAFYDQPHPEIVAREETVLLTFDRTVYQTIQSKLLEEIYEKSKDEIADLIKSDFFIELHLKDTKAKRFFKELKPEFYFKGEQICQAGNPPDKFYIIFKGRVRQENHIFIREHNKWPLPNRRWEVRAVYNSFKNSETIKNYDFFGDQEIINALRLKSSYITETSTILFSMEKDKFIDSLTAEDFKRLKKYRNEHVNINYTQFQKSVRNKVRSQRQKKKIIHKAIDTSFVHRNEFPQRKVSLIEQFEKFMTQSGKIDLKSVDKELD